MLVNNETGARFPLEKAVPLIRKNAPLAFIHCDAVQAAGKISIQASRWQVDALSVSAHKIHGPKGVGALYLRKGARILPRQLGGKQERSLRSGTEAVPLISAFGEACKALPLVSEQTQHFQELKQTLLDRLAQDERVTFHLPKDGVPYIIHLSLPGFRSETVLHFLSERDIFVSSGSACSKGAKSPVLTAMGLPPEQIDSAIRVSLCHQNTIEDIHRFADAVLEAMQSLAYTAPKERT
jgi:cysteine desulfurase